MYTAVNIFAWYSTHLFFRDITVINSEYVPKEGATIIYGNHNNQFVDGMLLMNVVKRPISFIAAAKSCQRPFIGSCIKATGAIPVSRPQDIAYKGQGNIISMKNNIVIGHNTKFTKLIKGTSFEIKGIPQLRITDILSDIQVKVDKNDLNFQGQNAYKIIPKIQYNELYDKVWTSLKQGRCIGIYPEGGSHDRLELLPLKAGICIMALGAMQKYGINVKLVPCGFNYYNPQNFRSKAILQFGPTYQIPKQLVELYRKDKKRAISILLQNVQKMLKNVTIEFRSFNELNALFLSRELYCLAAKKQVTIKEQLQLNRRFAKGYQIIANDEQYKQMYTNMLKFAQFVSLSGIPLKKQNYFGSKLIDFLKFIFYLQKCILRSVIALPGVVMFGATTTLIAYLAQKQRIKCLKGSKVKQYGNDVVGSYKILLSSILLPLTSAVHSGILYWALKKYSKLEQKMIIKLCIGLFALMPVYALLFVKSYDSFKKSWKKLKYIFFRTFKSNIYSQFNGKKKEIQKQIIQMVNKLGPSIIPNFSEQNRVIKDKQLSANESQFFIFDEQNDPKE